MDIGSVPGEIGILPGYREGYRNPPGAIWAFRGLSGKEKGAAQGGCASSPSPSPSRIPPPIWNRKRGREKEKEGRGRPPSLVQFGPDQGEGCGHLLRPFSPFPYGPLRPIRIPVTLRYFEKYPNHSEPFRSPNIVVQSIDIYVSTISRLLVISPISSGTLNSFGTSKLNKDVIVTLSVRTLRVRELCRHDRDTSPVNNQ